MKGFAWMRVGSLFLVAACSASTEDAQTGTLSAAETTATAQQDSTGGDAGRPHRAPPPEAFAACDGKAAGDACTVTTPDDKTIDGTCADPPPDAQDTRLACRPNGPPPGGDDHGPPGQNGGGDCQGKAPPAGSSSSSTGPS